MDGIIAFSLQIYFDFYGYSLMAKGLGQLMGFSLPDNFAHPYLSLSMTEFWRRWHITLGSWFRDYIYIPLGGNRKGSLDTVRQSADCLASYRILAWSQLEFPSLGTDTVSSDFYRKSRTGAGFAPVPSSGTSVHDAGHSPQLADFCQLRIWDR